MHTAGAQVPPRLRWAVDLLDPRPDDVVLEVGGGPGVSAALLCERLATGRLLALDRSAVALERTGRRNPGHLAAGRLVLVHGGLADASLEPASVDRALAVDVGLFWTGSADAELAVLGRALRPGARLCVLYGAGGPTGPDRVLTAVTASVRRHGFGDVTPVVAQQGFGVVARAPAPSAPTGTLVA